ncbi:Phosphate regulon transcriptional regulatory protein PhoB [Pirellula sp. SH-Sr6A]|uniref:response regulator n=1 Tax=Pirellula sp. SH-Sr6A TaxID=1632865 RepID=UPI00078DB3A3|nr:response regulator [Pirellula sp. SH-Sr6A]AMV31124.1 Phosphate regulon transcriptional regulatory protein PhoB [Pirellula sp. SH-Sr6A]
MPRTKVLVVEDDRALSEVLLYNLDKAGYEVFKAFDGRDGLNQAQLRLPDVILLDVMLPVIDGVEVCRRLRANPETAKLNVILLTAKSEESDQLIGFSVGADDYVTKPFSVRVLLERIKSLLRRKSLALLDDNDIVTRRGITLDRRKYRATVDEQPVELTKSEFRLLDTLMRQPGRAFERCELIDSALGEDTLVLERTIDVHIRAIRKKVGEKANAIETVRGVGYRFQDD